MNTIQNDQPETTLITNVSDSDMLRYLIKECGKTKDEWANEIKERFWTNVDLTSYLNKPS